MIEIRRTLLNDYSQVQLGDIIISVGNYSSFAECPIVTSVKPDGVKYLCKGDGNYGKITDLSSLFLLRKIEGGLEFLSGQENSLFLSTGNSKLTNHAPSRSETRDDYIPIVEEKSESEKDTDYLPGH